MPDANGRFRGISTYGISNPYLEEIECRNYHKRRQARRMRDPEYGETYEHEHARLTAMATGRAVYTPQHFAP